MGEASVERQSPAVQADPVGRSRAEDGLSRILREWTATLDAIPDLISVHDGEFRLVRVNRALARHLGRKPEELIGRRCHRLWHGTEVPWPDCPHRAAWRTGATVTREIVDPRTDHPFQITCSPYWDEHGRLVGTVHVARDVAEAKRLEAEREALIVRLQEALAQTQRLGGLLPICASCKRIRDDRGYWNQLEAYFEERSAAEFTHGICPECRNELYAEWRGTKGDAVAGPGGTARRGRGGTGGRSESCSKPRGELERSEEE